MQGSLKSLALLAILGFWLVIASGQSLRNPEQFYARGTANGFLPYATKPFERFPDNDELLITGLKPRCE